MEPILAEVGSLAAGARVVDVQRDRLDETLLLTWTDGMAAGITEARVLKFAGMYLDRPKPDDSRLRSRLSPLPYNKDASVIARPPLVSPWRVILLGDSAGKLLESNLLLCLNDSPRPDFSWVRPGKTTFHWWYGEFEDFDKQPGKPGASLFTLLSSV